jgi:5,10-methylenetetrahydrofolate reductase
MFGAPSDFAILAEIEPATKPDLSGVRRQIAVLTPVADAFLVPDNHLGRATVSSIAVAHEVAYMGGRVVACINGRDRNELGFDRDLLTAAAYGVDHLLLVGGDRPPGDANGGMKVSAMLRTARAARDDPRFRPDPLTQGNADGVL